ncbi:hypothetical protein PVAP13_2NG222403, partial [Panicum virgatum]
RADIPASQTAASHLQASTKAKGSSSKKVTGSGAVQLPRVLVKCPMQQSLSVTAPGAPVAIDMADAQQLLEEMPLWSVHFQISWVENKTCTLSCIVSCSEHLY